MKLVHRLLPARRRCFPTADQIQCSHETLTCLGSAPGHCGLCVIIDGGRFQRFSAFRSMSLNSSASTSCTSGTEGIAASMVSTAAASAMRSIVLCSSLATS